MVAVELNRSLMEQVLVDGGTDSHVLLAETANMGVNILRILSLNQLYTIQSALIIRVKYQLLFQGHLLELQVVDLGGNAGQEGGREQRGQLHDRRQ